MATTPTRTATELIADFGKTDKLNDRIRVLRALAVVGREESVPFLVELLAHDAQPVRDYAIAAVAANPTAAAAAAIVAALREAREPGLRVALIQAVGSRRESSAVETLESLAGDAGDADEAVAVAVAAIAALGGIGTPAAGKALAAVQAKAAPPRRQKAVQASLLCADRLRERGEKDAARDLYRLVHTAAGTSHLRMAGLRGLVLVSGDESLPLLIRVLETGTVQEQAAAAHITVELPGATATAALLAALPTLPPSAQSFLLEALADRAVR